MIVLFSAFPRLRLNSVGNVLMVLIAMIAFIVLMAFAGNLTAFLSIPRYEKPIDSLDDLVARPSIVTAVRFGTSYHRFVEVSINALQKANLQFSLLRGVYINRSPCIIANFLIQGKAQEIIKLKLVHDESE